MNTINVYTIFIIMGLIIVVSFLSTTFFSWTRIPSAIILILIGIFLHFWNTSLDINVLRQIAPVFGAFALLLILLEAGLELDIRHFFKIIGPAFIFGILSYACGVISIIWILKKFFAFQPVIAILLALVSVGGSPAILLPIAKGMHIEKNDKIFLDLECTVTEILGLILLISFLPSLLPTLINNDSFVLKTLLFMGAYKLFFVFLGAVFVPFILGMLWSRLLSFAGDKPLWPILTIGIALLLYGGAESLGGKGALNVFVFGLVIGNAQLIWESLAKFFVKLRFRSYLLKRYFHVLIGESFANLHHISLELSFFVRTFFFVYLGAIVDFSEFSLQTVWIACVLTFLPMLVRAILAFTVHRMKFITIPPPMLLTFLIPRGLANVLAAFIVITHATKMQLPPNIMFVLNHALIEPVFGLIIMSNIVLPFFLFFRKESEAIEGQSV